MDRPEIRNTTVAAIFSRAVMRMSSGILEIIVANLAPA
jgi:hypothetical protein